MELRDRLRNTIIKAVANACYLQPDDLRPDLPMLDLGLDSLAIASIVGELESQWKYEFREEEINALFQVSDVGGLVQTAMSIVEPHAVA